MSGGYDWDQAQRDYDLVVNSDGSNSIGHDALAGCAAFTAMHYWEGNQHRHGMAVSHSFAKGVIAAYAAGEADKVVDLQFGNSGDRIDSDEMQQSTQRKAEQLYDLQYGQNDNYDLNNTRPAEQLRNTFGYANYT